MNFDRRRVLQSLALTVGVIPSVEGAEPAVTLDALRNASAAIGTNLGDDRLRVIRPALEQRLPQLQALRDFEVDDAVEPTPGIASK